ncbi:MAG TPA: TraR/DksA C4-type zinc finger protein [Acidimicrobiales bacterium]
MTEPNRPVSRAVGTRTLDPALLQVVRASLQERHDALSHRLKLLEAELPGDVIDGPQDVGDVEFVRLQYENTRLQLLEVSAALRRLDSGEYGFCATCGAPIEPDRLEAVPETTHCVACSAR